MTEAMTSVGVPGILAYLLVREVFAFVNKRRNGRNGRNGCPSGMRREHAVLLARHDQSLVDVREDFKEIKRRLERIEAHLVKRG
jgi:hypothetical protein